MDDTLYGTRNQRGEWSPSRRVEYAPLFVWPARPVALLRWLFGYPGYVLPFNLVSAAVAFAAWFVATPSRATMASFGVGWIAVVLVRNAVVLIAWYGVFHLHLYVRRAQDTRFKYNARWPAAQ
ncbi:MAG: sterol desaturase family protein, partial [Ilumatobacteraceae bacterium]